MASRTKPSANSPLRLCSQRISWRFIGSPAAAICQGVLRMKRLLTERILSKSQNWSLALLFSSESSSTPFNYTEKALSKKTCWSLTCLMCWKRYTMNEVRVSHLRISLSYNLRCSTLLKHSIFDSRMNELKQLWLSTNRFSFVNFRSFDKLAW